MAPSTALASFDPSHPQSDTPYASSDLPLPTATTTTPSTDLSRQEPDWPRKPSLSVISRPRELSTTLPSTSSVKRKPLPSNASPVATRLSLSSEPEHLPRPPFIRSYELDSPTLYENPLTPRSSTKETSSIYEPDVEEKQRNFRRSDETLTLTTTPPLGASVRQRDSQRTLDLSIPPSPETPSSATSAESVTPSDNYAIPLRRNSIVSTAPSSVAPRSEHYTPAATPHAAMSMFSTKPTPPHLALPGSLTVRSFSGTSTDQNVHTNNTPPPKSPGASKLGSFFGWGGNTSPSSTASYSNPVSPNVSPKKNSPPQKQPSSAARNIPPGIDTKRANASVYDYFGDAYLAPPSTTPATTVVQVEEMEDELKTISAELATSIRREMELEDLVERLQYEAANPQGQGRRTSDYFSDSGTSSVRYAGETDSKAEELDRLQRKTEREKAQIRLELHEKVQDERSRRKVLESQIRTLEEKASQVDLVSMNSMDTNGRLKELENTCEDLRRRLGEERRVKDNFEDLLTALKGELQNSHNERDNLRDEIVPQLRSRVEGLEAQASQHEKLTYENTKMQQEMQSLRDENVTLANARRLQMDMQQQMTRFNSIVEETPPITPQGGGTLSRSNSVAQRSVRAGSLTRSSSVKITESREALAERVKDIEMQRDALHSALKSLLERQEHQNRENEKKIRQLEMERTRILSSSPRRLGFDRDVANLREEINTLRRRADEAIEQKWQCEKGLGGLKMDLDRAEQEIASLRSLLKEKDILIPPGTRQPNEDRLRNNSVTSATLEQAYRELQKNYAESLDKMRKMEASPGNAETEKAIKDLENSLATTISERDFAIQEANQFRHTVESLHTSEKGHMSSEVALADELRSSAKRVEDLATQVRQQLASNAALRQRLSETIERGEQEQKANASRIVHMQGKLKNLEDAILTAQQASEESVTKHEEELRTLKESHNAQLLRVKAGLKSRRSFAPKTPLTPLFANGTNPPRIDFTSSGKGISIEEQTQTDFLKRKVLELEKALEEADSEMEEVVGKMNVAQIEVMELQNEREEAVRETRRLQAAVEKEKLNNFEGRFATLRS